ncbi:hypothetical protein ATO10_13319 [Actibacterium atlanticum]|uniref:NADH dehydrogenase subunit E n=1 Tax=Actibacterium atlanticum TaxID=1461693 RepID=A0A058ZHV1_9RHOB|nr:hypothetical protein [Actibacterium atlanticum]KCV81163.1 hypothetical protein ATO10_13319 [Actibacterium atlanticum]
MFREWGFLITEMVVLIILAALLGLLVGWLIWGRREVETVVEADTSQADALRADLAGCRDNVAQQTAQIATLQADLDAAQLATSEANARADAAASAAAEAVAPVAAAATVMPEPEPAPLPEAEPINQDFDGDGVVEGTDEGAKPTTLTQARGGQADDLKQIKGIGPKLELLCNKLGFYHFDQIAAWSDQEVAWVDANLEGFKGRVSRDKWVEQAQLLADGGETEFSKRVEDGDVY